MNFVELDEQSSRDLETAFDLALAESERLGRHIPRGGYNSPRFVDAINAANIRIDRNRLISEVTD